MIITPELTCQIINTNLIRSVYGLITNGKLYIVHPSILSINRFIDLIYMFIVILCMLLSVGRLKTRNKETFTGVDG